MNFLRPASSIIAATTESPRSSRPQRRWPISYRSVGVIAISLDIVVILLCGVASGIFYNFEAYGAPGEIFQYFGSAAVVAALFVSVMKGHNLYSPTELLALRT